jgi:hypothetical protein
MPLELWKIIASEMGVSGQYIRFRRARLGPKSSCGGELLTAGVLVADVISRIRLVWRTRVSLCFTPQRLSTNVSDASRMSRSLALNFFRLSLLATAAITLLSPAPARSENWWFDYQDDRLYFDFGLFYDNNASANIRDGYNIANMTFGATVEGNTATGNTDDGFDVGSGLWAGGRVVDNVSNDNAAFGLRITNRTGGCASGNSAAGNADNTLPAP